MTTSATELRAAIASVLADIAPEIDLGAIDASGNLRDEIDLDSLDALRLIEGLESRLGVTIPEADHATVGSLDDLVAYLARRSAEQPTGYDRRDDESADTR